ncbi:MAG TPA: hypothetical protein VFJ84_00145 [Candidatus Saccharimonadales bacterium]|nr:hypothetical protein [Candidatus Saccharimonadales bacterium]
MPGETLTTAETPPAEAGSFPEPSGGYPAGPHSAEGLMLDPVEWQADELPAAPELLTVAAQPEASAQVFTPDAEKHAPAEAESKAEEPEETQEQYSSADGWAISGRNTDKDEIILKRQNPDFPSGYEIKRVKPSQFQESAEPVIEPEALPAPAAEEPQPPDAAESTSEETQSDVLVDQQGNLWRYKGKSSETGMHKIESLTENHTKFLTDERMKEFSNFEPEAAPEAQAADSAEEAPAPLDPEKEQMREQFQQLSDRVAKLEAMLQEKESPYEIKPGGLVPVYSWAKGFESARILEEGERDGESFYKVITAEGDTRTFFKDEVEYWFSHRAEPEAAPTSRDEAQKRFSGKFKAVREELKQLGSAVKSAAKDALEPMAAEAMARAGYVAGAAKEALGTSLMMGQVIGEKAADAAKEAAVSAVLTGQVLGEKAAGAVANGTSAVAEAAKESAVTTALTSQVIGEKAGEKARQYRRRLIGRAAGYTAVFSIWLLGPSETELPADTEDKEEERVESPPLAA